MVGGPHPDSSGDDAVREINQLFTIWEQIEVFCREVDRRPNNPRSWKLLGFAYMWAGAYVPVLLYIGEHCLRAALARTVDDAESTRNIEDKLAVIAGAKAGDAEIRRDLASAEAVLAAPSESFPAKIPVPRLFHESGLTPGKYIFVNDDDIAIDGFDESETEPSGYDFDDENYYH
jgi:hypothetical protein